MAAALEVTIYGKQVYPGVYGYKAPKGYSSCSQDTQHPPIIVRRFDDGKEFFGFKDEVLIPRLGTHILMRQVVQNLVGDMGKEGLFTAVDVGTGSGIAALYMAEAVANNRDATIIATDINQHALEFADMNFQKNSIRKRAVFVQTDLLTGIEEHYGKANFIFSNPPFAPTEEVPRNGFDPLHAYDGGSDGLEFYRRIAKQSSQLLCPDGVLLFQISPCAPIKELISIAQTSFPNSKIGLIGAAEGPLNGKGYGPIGMLIGPETVVQRYANRGIL